MIKGFKDGMGSDGNDCNFCCGDGFMSTFLYAKTHQIINFKYVQVLVHKLYLNKAIIKSNV